MYFIVENILRFTIKSFKDFLVIRMKKFYVYKELYMYNEEFHVPNLEDFVQNMEFHVIFEKLLPKIINIIDAFEANYH